MSNAGDDPLIDGVQQWQAGVVVLVLVALAATAGAFGLGALGVPYGEGIGLVVGATVGFLAVSYWFYGR